MADFELLKLANGDAITMPTLAAIDQVIEKYEKDLRFLRTIRRNMESHHDRGKTDGGKAAPVQRGEAPA